MGRRRHKIVLSPYESEVQAAVLEHWLKLGLPNTLVAAIPNAFAHGQPGLTRGLPDLLVIEPCLPVGFIELKRDKDSVVSDAQRGFGSLCAKLGIPYAVCVGRDEPIKTLECWKVVRKQASDRSSPQGEGEALHSAAFPGEAELGGALRSNAGKKGSPQRAASLTP